MSCIITKKEAAKRSGGYHPESIMRLVRQGRFPKPVVLSPTKIGFVEDEVDRWIADRIAERDGDEAA